MEDLKNGLKYLVVAYNHLIPAPAHLSACVDSVQALQPNHHHDVTKDNIRQIVPVLYGHHLILSLK